MRHFFTAGGRRRWTATLCDVTRWDFGSRTAIAISGEILRFTSSDGLVVNIHEWPENWQEISDESLVDLLYATTRD